MLIDQSNADPTLSSVSDSVMGNWNYSYDSLNRLTAGSANSATGSWAGTLGWSYDSFGNNQGQTATGNFPFTISQGSYSYYANNQMVGVSYDASGNVLSSGTLGYVYDAENRIATVNGSVAYVYDAEGNRVAKETINGQNVTLTNQYLLGPGGEQVSELDGNGNWLRSYVYGGGKELAKYDAHGLHFDFTDWLGSRRVQALASTTAVEESCVSLPFGDSLQCLGQNGQPNSDDDGHHFTGKERDTESGLDYFGARYYASNMGRWMSPDPKAPSSKTLMNPQKWNKYNYVLNNPLSMVDPDGQEEITVVIRAYIPQQSFKFPPLIGPTWKGDNRGPSRDASSWRVQGTVTIETDPAIRGGKDPVISATSSTTGSAATWFGHTKTGNSDTSITASGSYDANGNASVNIHVAGSDPLVSFAPTVSGSFTLTAPMSGDQATLSGTVTPYPAWEAYGSSASGAQGTFFQTSLAPDATPANIALGQTQSVSGWINMQHNDDQKACPVNPQ